MIRITKAVGPVAILAALTTVGTLFATHRLRFDWHGEQPSAGGTEKKPDHDEDASHVVEGKVVLDADAIAAAGIKTALAAVGSLSIGLDATGEIELASDRVAHVTPRIPGTLRGVERTVGDTVRSGDHLCTIESVELGQTRAEHVSADSELTLTERNLTRWQELFEKGLRTQNELWGAENEYTRAKIRHEAATGKLKALGIDDEGEIAALDSRTLNNRYVVKSPVAGTILERHATLGENVDTKDILFLIADLSEVWVEAAIYEKDLAAVRVGMNATIRTQAFPNIAFRGVVTYVGQKVDEKSRTVPVRVSVKNGPVACCADRYALRPGMFAAVSLEVSRKDDVVLVPHAGVQLIGPQAVVFVRVPLPHGHGAPGSVAFERRAVTVGERDDESVEIVKGLNAGEEVVVENAYLLKSELDKSRIADSD